MPEITLTAWQILLVKIAIILAVVPAAAIVAGYAEHKVMAHLQHRLGPMYPGGFHGWAVLLADGLKFLYKEDIIPAAADRRVFKLVPAVVLTPVIMAYLVVPMDRNLVVENLDVGLFYLLAISGVPAIGLVMAGWSSANKYAIIGTFRAAAQFISYELPIALSAAAIAVLAGSLSLVEIVEAQRWAFIFWPPGLGLALFTIFTISSIAEMTRPPFDMPVAESEIITGPFTEYSGMRFIFSFFLPEVAHMVVLGAIGATLFLGGYMPIVPWGPLEVIPGFVWFLVKTAFMVFLFLWIRPTFPRLREDQLMTFAWKYLIPITLVLILAAGAWTIYA